MNTHVIDKSTRRPNSWASDAEAELRRIAQEQRAEIERLRQLLARYGVAA